MGGKKTPTIVYSWQAVFFRHQSFLGLIRGGQKETLQVLKPLN